MLPNRNNSPIKGLLLRFFSTFVGELRQLGSRHKKKKKRYAHQVFGNVGNFQIAYSDGIVVLTL